MRYFLQMPELSLNLKQYLITNNENIPHIAVIL